MSFCRQKILSILLAVCLLSFCGGSASTIQSALNGSGPLLNFLVKNGKLTQAKADALKQDFTDAGKCAADLDRQLDAIAKDDPNARAKKYNAWLTSANFCWKPIVLRQNFAADPKIQRISQIVDAIFAGAIFFYSPPPPSMGAVAEVKDEKAFEGQLDRQVKELKEAMKP